MSWQKKANPYIITHVGPHVISYVQTWTPFFSVFGGHIAVYQLSTFLLETSLF